MISSNYLCQMTCAPVKAYSDHISYNPEALCCNLQTIPSYLIADLVVSPNSYFPFGFRDRPRFLHVIWLALSLCPPAIYHGKLSSHLQVPLFSFAYPSDLAPFVSSCFSTSNSVIAPSIRLLSARFSLSGLSSISSSP